MGKKKRGIVEQQKMDVIPGGPDSYTRYTEQYEGDDRGAHKSTPSREDMLANPDLLPEHSTSPSTPQLLMGEAIEHLQGRQKEVYLMHMREDMSLAEVGEALDMAKGTAQTYLDRAISFISQYCQRAIDEGRV